VTIAEEKG